MKNEELKELFDENGLKQSNFVTWARSKGVEITSGEVSRHTTRGGISRWAELAYLSFFEEMKSNKGFSVPEDFGNKLIEAMKDHFAVSINELKEKIDQNSSL